MIVMNQTAQQLFIKLTRNKNAFFSIITVCLNNKDGVARTERSISNQKERDFEWIVIDGCSTDGTVEFVKNSKNAPLLVSEKDTGIYNAMNKGIKFSQGKYCLFLNAGDELYSDDVLMEIKKNKETDIIVGRMQVICNDNQRKNKIKDFSQQDIRKKYLYSRSLPHPATFIKRNIFSVYGYYDEFFSIAGDHDFFARVLTRGASISFSPVCVSIFYMDGISTTMKNSKIFADELATLQKKNFSFFYRIWREIAGIFNL